jgi:hypothetical protein
LTETIEKKMVSKYFFFNSSQGIYGNKETEEKFG